MKAYNITPYTTILLALVGAIAANTVAAALLSGSIASGVGFVVGIIVACIVFWVMQGDRLWITPHSWLPFGIMWKPRGYDMTTTLGGQTDDDGGKVACVSCNDTFKAAYDHFRSDRDHYCPDCSQVGEVVMKNYQEWFDSTEDVRQAAD